MEFADSRCAKCGAEFGEAKPKTETKVEQPYTSPSGRVVEFVGPCPNCGENIPLWAGTEELPAEPTEPTGETEPAEPSEPEA